ncbi:MAG: HAMP domain-containing histidine kinase [Candidatus Nomurabacteria bacterium]|jgi:two-component system sensor histidine kinase TctE|nr:HAMP domain-containing histidine kinase [Candidatus Nomurabacteria bacterium]
MNSEGVDLSLAACAYELKTPLVLMRQLALELEKAAQPARRAEICQQMRLTAEKSLRLADNLTKAARLEEALFEFEPVQVAGLCREAADEMLLLARAKKQQVNVRISRKTAVCVGNRELLKALLVGLLDNALQSGPENGKIYIMTRINQGKIELAVRDNGPIVELAQFRRLQQSLGKFSRPIAARPLMSGLGLAVAEKFAVAMNGQLAISRHHAGGMTFRALLPVSRQLSILETLR